MCDALGSILCGWVSGKKLVFENSAYMCVCGEGQRWMSSSNAACLRRDSLLLAR